ncbi:HD-GYP domain-containing protein [Crateriforma conspicua]|uniref:HD-GYP domain-containing protein n=1 Tax=Crateriforma conspicua TaxID=2527996 RepID=A0A5C5XZY9_9PLAN|nr:HD domain-containing phosphohydrolase [Crateriforma conspicua]TWT68464.1 hypothetical protein Pan14r_07090 [Crateriforma conspicua]
MSKAEFTEMIQTADLELGQKTETDLYDSAGELMITQGSLITGLLIEKLMRNGVEQLYTTPGRGGKDGDAPTTQPSADTAKATAPASPAQKQADAAMSAYDEIKRERTAKLFFENAAIVDDLLQQYAETGRVDLRTVDPAIENIADEVTDESDPVVAHTLLRQSDLDLTRRCVQFSTLAIGVGLRMNLAHKDVMDLGRAAMAHDWTLFELPPNQRFPHQSRDEAGEAIYRQHPLQSEQMMAADPRCSSTASMIVGQVHERLDGTGFPRRLKSESIHPLGRILTVVDTYLTLTSPPPSAPRIVPCDAVAYIVNGMSSGKFAPIAVSGLLETISLYPLGSMVELSDASRVRPIHTNGSDYGYPIVQDIDEAGRQINLKESELFVTRPLVVQEFGEIRMPESVA